MKEYVKPEIQVLVIGELAHSLVEGSNGENDIVVDQDELADEFP